MRIVDILSFMIIFVAGALAALLLSQIPVFSDEKPLAFGSFFSDGTIERPSPYDWIKEDQIAIYRDKVVINLENAQLAGFVDTNSMDPLLDENSNGIEIIPESIADIHIGDVVSYKSGSDVIIHRVVGIGYDEQGWYAIMKGDNNKANDPGRVRFEQIQRVLVGVIY